MFKGIYIYIHIYILCIQSIYPCSNEYPQPFNTQPHEGVIKRDGKAKTNYYVLVMNIPNAAPF